MNNQYVYRTTPSDSTLAIGMAYYAIQQGLTHAAPFFGSTSNVAGVVDPLVKAYTGGGRGPEGRQEDQQGQEREAFPAPGKERSHARPPKL